jgi:hypothetical protein
MENFTLVVPFLGIVAFLFATALAIIAFFLKRQIARTDAAEDEIRQMKEDFARRAEMDKMEQSIITQIGSMEGRFNSRMDKVDNEIKTIRESYITTDTFVREIGKLTQQNDRIYGILLDLTRERK